METESAGPDFAARFLEGVDHFNRREFWEAHESWEEIWLAAGTEAAEFLQGMIQLAAAYHHIRRGTLRGAVRLVDAALGRLEEFEEGYCGIERSELVAAARRHQQQAREHLAGGLAESLLSDAGFPKIALVEGWRERLASALLG